MIAEARVEAPADRFSPRALLAVFDDAEANLRAKIVAIYVVLIAATVVVWGLALMAFATRPLLLGTALLAYTFGLRHAVDADHISAIDNVTRKLMQEGKRPVSVGFFFSLGHSTVVIGAVGRDRRRGDVRHAHDAAAASGRRARSARRCPRCSCT